MCTGLGNKAAAANLPPVGDVFKEYQGEDFSRKQPPSATAAEVFTNTTPMPAAANDPGGIYEERKKKRNEGPTVAPAGSPDTTTRIGGIR